MSLLKVTPSSFFLPNAPLMQLEERTSIPGETRATLPWYLLDSEIPIIHKNVHGLTVYVKNCLVLLPLDLPSVSHPARAGQVSHLASLKSVRDHKKIKNVVSQSWIWMMFEWFLFFLSTHILFTQCRITAWFFAIIPSPNQMLWEQSLSICRVSTGPCTQAD